jgi:hypothetical protein
MNIETEHIETVFRLLSSAGLRMPPEVEADPHAAITTYAIVLGDVAPRACVAAAVAYIRSGARFWPAAGELLAQVPESCEGLSWGEAWALLSETARRTPGGTAYGSPPDRFHHDPATDAGLRAGLQALGGWRAFGMLREGDEGTARAHFRAAYDAVKTRSKVAGQHRQLTDTLVRAGLIGADDTEQPSGFRLIGGGE